MKTKLPKEYSNLPEFNYDIKLKTGLYYTINPQLQKMNCKNYSIKPKDEVTISTLGEFSIITLEAIGRTKVQYLVTAELDLNRIESVPERNLLDEYKQYLILAKENMKFYKEFVNNNL